MIAVSSTSLEELRVLAVLQKAGGIDNGDVRRVPHVGLEQMASAGEDHFPPVHGPAVPDRQRVTRLQPDPLRAGGERFEQHFRGSCGRGVRGDDVVETATDPKPSGVDGYGGPR